jgi:hypothetical protein
MDLKTAGIDRSISGVDLGGVGGIPPWVVTEYSSLKMSTVERGKR